MRVNKLVLRCGAMTLAGMLSVSCGVDKKVTPIIPPGVEDAQAVDPVEGSYETLAHLRGGCDKKGKTVDSKVSHFKIEGMANIFGSGRTLYTYDCDGGECSDDILGQWVFDKKEDGVWQGFPGGSSSPTYQDGEKVCQLYKFSSSAELEGDEAQLTYMTYTAVVPPIDGDCIGDDRVSKLLEKHDGDLKCESVEILVGKKTS